MGLTYAFLPQVRGERAIISGNISSLPRSIAKERTIFATGEYPAQFAIGPIAEKPGPMLLNADAAAVMFVSRSNGSKLNTRKMRKKQTI